MQLETAEKETKQQIRKFLYENIYTQVQANDLIEDFFNELRIIFNGENHPEAAFDKFIDSVMCKCFKIF